MHIGNVEHKERINNETARWFAICVLGIRNIKRRKTTKPPCGLRYTDWECRAQRENKQRNRHESCWLRTHISPALHSPLHGKRCKHVGTHGSCVRSNNRMIQQKQGVRPPKQPNETARARRSFCPNNRMKQQWQGIRSTQITE